MDAKNNNGQAIFEFIIFLPFLIFLFITMISVGNSINSSINQQKVTRRYFYNIVSNLSTGIRSTSVSTYQNAGIKLMGMNGLGFAEKSVNDSPFGSCFKLQAIFYPEAKEDTCDEPYDEEGSSFYIRTFTYYGICSETYFVTGGTLRTYHNGPSLAKSMSGNHICTLSNNF